MINIGVIFAVTEPTEKGKMKENYFYIVKHYSFIILTMLIATLNVQAQYETIRFPQKAEEIALYKKNKIMGETQIGIDSSKKIPYLSRAFDSEGRIVISQDYNHIKYYKYDEKGNVIDFLDSARTSGTNYTVTEYKFTYDENGMLKNLVAPDFKSQFAYNAAKKILTETLVKNDTTRKNRYYYDTNGRMKESIFYSPQNYRIAHTIHNYSSTGRINNECYVQMTSTSKDSTLQIYEYNDKNQLEKKELFRFIEFKYSSNGTGSPNRSASHYGSATYTYELDSAGRPLGEEYSVKDDKLNYSYSTWAYDKNGLITKDTYLYAHGEPKTTEHVYYYFDK